MPNRKKLAVSILVGLLMVAAGVWVYPGTTIDNPALNLLASAFWGAFVGAAIGVVLALAVGAILMTPEWLRKLKEWLYDR